MVLDNSRKNHAIFRYEPTLLKYHFRFELDNVFQYNDVGLIARA